jgi:transient receptor potential cation channel subfamily V member 5
MKQIFDYLVNIERIVYWIYANISCAAYVLTEVDTIDEMGATNTRSALYLIVNGVSLVFRLIYCNIR